MSETIARAALRVLLDVSAERLRRAAPGARVSVGIAPMRELREAVEREYPDWEATARKLLGQP